MDVDEKLLAIYTPELIALSETTRAPRRLTGEDLRQGRAVSPICGSIVEIDLRLDDNNAIINIGYNVEACALTRAVMAVLKNSATGLTQQDLTHAARDLASMLTNGPTRPQGKFEPLLALDSVRDFPARHNALLLPFEAALRALKTKDAAPQASATPHHLR